MSRFTIGSAATFCMPAWVFGVAVLLRPDRIKSLKDRKGVKIRRAKAKVELFNYEPELEFDVIVISTKKPDAAKKVLRLIWAAFKETSLIWAALKETSPSKWDTTLCVVGKETLPLVLPKKGKMKFLEVDKLNAADKETHTRNLPAMTKCLNDLSRLSGREIDFYCQGGLVRCPSRDPVKTSIYTSSAPPGDGGSRYLKAIGGIDVSLGSLSVLSYKPAAGRGVVMSDKEGPLVQVIGSNVYLLPPVIIDGEVSHCEVVFRKLMTLAWRGLQTKVPATKKRNASRREFVDTSVTWIDAIKENVEKQVTSYDKSIEDLQRQLAAMFRAKKESVAVLQAFEKAGFQRQTIRRMPKDFERIKAEPDIASVRIIEDGIQVETTPIVVEHESVEYLMGVFTIRINKFGAVSVWCETPLHPLGLAHPHIGKDGCVCYGNATQAIVSACAEHRYYDTIRYVVSWLKHGYSPATTLNKIETWPRKVPLSAAQVPSAPPQPSAQNGTTQPETSASVADDMRGMP